MAHDLLDEAFTPDPKTLKLLGQAFDEAWRDMAGLLAQLAWKIGAIVSPRLSSRLRATANVTCMKIRAKRWRSCGARSSAAVTEA